MALEFIRLQREYASDLDETAGRHRNPKFYPHRPTNPFFDCRHPLDGARPRIASNTIYARGLSILDIEVFAGQGRMKKPIRRYFSSRYKDVNGR